jgi:hypothetical protein
LKNGIKETQFCFIVGGYALKKQMLDDRRFPKLHINLQRLLQVRYTSLILYINLDLYL